MWGLRSRYFATDALLQGATSEVYLPGSISVGTPAGSCFSRCGPWRLPSRAAVSAFGRKLAGKRSSRGLYHRARNKPRHSRRGLRGAILRRFSTPRNVCSTRRAAGHGSACTTAFLLACCLLFELAADPEASSGDTVMLRSDSGARPRNTRQGALSRTRRPAKSG